MSRRLTVRLWVAVLAAMLWQWPSARAGEADKYLPDDPFLIVSFNSRQILESAVVKNNAMEPAKSVLQAPGDAQKFLTAAGFDPLKDVSRLLLALTRGPKGGTFQAVGIIKGRFDPEKFHAALEASAKDQRAALKIHKEEGIRLYEGKANDHEPVFAALLDKETLVVSSSRDQVLKAAKRPTGGKPAHLGKEMQSLLNKADDSMSLWVVGKPPVELNKFFADNPQTKSLVNAITGLSGGVALSGDIQIDVHIHATGAKAAVEVRKFVEGAKGILTFLALSNEEFGPLLADVIGSLAIVHAKNEVTISGKVTGETIEKGIKKARKIQDK